MYIEHNPHDKNYPYIIRGSWDQDIYTTEYELRKLREDIDKILGDIEESKKE